MATKTKKTTTTKTEEKVGVNGSYEFLVNHFAEPSSIIDAATALAGHSKIDPQIAAKKVEQFLENAKLDQTLEVRAGTGSNEGQYIIMQVPQSAQRKNGGREVKKVAEKKLTDPEAVKVVMLEQYHSVDEIVSKLSITPHFHNRSEKRIKDVVLGMTRKFFAAWRHAQGLKVEKREHNGQVEYRLFTNADPN